MLYHGTIRRERFPQRLGDLPDNANSRSSSDFDVVIQMLGLQQIEVTSTDLRWRLVCNRWNATTVVRKTFSEGKNCTSIWNDGSWLGNDVAES